MNIPIFPLPVFLLPDGITRLRIFEQRYLNMVKIASKGDGFAILLACDDNLDAKIASWVDIINFDTSDEGLLQIDVKCKSLIELSAITSDENNLMWANIKNVKHWDVQKHDDFTLEFTELLRLFFVKNTELFDLYDKTLVNQPNWIIARWLEALPIDNIYKAHFLLPDTYSQAHDLLTELLLSKK